MSYIPGLVLRPVEEENLEGCIRTSGFDSTIIIPESHKYGNCKRVLEFKKIELIEEGSFGTLFKAEVISNETLVIMKRFKMPTNSPDGFPSWITREVSVLKSFNHSNIIFSHGVAVGKKLDSNYLILEYCPFSLKDLIDRNVFAIYEEHVTKSIMMQLLRGLEYIHNAKAIHRDITTQNILFTEMGVLKISGFSCIFCESQSKLAPSCTEMRYRAPELLLKAKTYDSTVDIWAAGCVFVELLLQKPIFKGNFELEVFMSICDVIGTPTEYIWPGVTELISAAFGKDSAILNSNEVDELQNFLSGFSYEVVKKIFFFFPEARASAEHLLVMNYFKTAPTACSSERFASVLKTVPNIKREQYSEKAWEV